MAGAAAEYRTEHVSETPRGWRVRMKSPGPQSSHLIAIAFPPGRRKKGSGRVVEILHPAGERNPRCEISEKARKNPGELLIFGNPGYIRRSLFHQLQEAAKERGEKFTQETTADGRNVYRYQGKLYTPGELADKLGVRWPNPMDAYSKLEAQRAARDRAARIRGARNPKGGFGNHKKACKCVFCEHQRKIAAADARMPKQIRDVMRSNPSIGTRVTVTEGSGIDSGKSGVVISWKGPRDQYSYKDESRSGHVWVRLDSGGERIFPKNRLRKANPCRSRNQRSTPRRRRGDRYFAVYSDREKKNRFALDSVETSRAAANKERARLRAAGHKAKVAGPRSDKNFPVERRRRNPDETKQAVHLFKSFHGRDPKDIAEKHVSAEMRKDYAAVGALEYLEVITPLKQTARFNFEGDGVTLASSPDGKQLYCIGGNQNLASCLTADSLQKDFIDLGECIEVQYLARKIHGNFEPTSYFHKFGEKTGARPQLAYDKLKKQIFFVGGEYFINTKQGIISPGIEN